jgi:SAM-dependent methyltransferase
MQRGLARLRRLQRRVVAAGDALVFPDGRAETARHWQRTALNQAVDAHIASLDPARAVAAEISGETHAGKPWKAYSSLMYPEFDLCAPLEDSRRYDVVICEQVLEHVPDPWAAASNLRAMCAPDGHVIVSTPFLVRVHELPLFAMGDYWRFTPRGLRTLLEGAGLEVETVGSWGNRACVIGNFNRWAARRPWHPMRNEPDFPIQVWAFARNRP